MTDPYKTRPIDLLMESDALNLRDHFLDRRTALASRLCVARDCAGDGTATAFRDPVSHRDYDITGLCQACQDAVYGMDDLNDGVPF